jgi:hypothetical protein
MAKPRVKFGKFEGDDREYADSAITLNGKDAGTITRVRTDEFESAASLRRVWSVHSYDVDLLEPFDVDDYRSFAVQPRNPGPWPQGGGESHRTAREALSAAKRYVRKLAGELQLRCFREADTLRGGVPYTGPE